MKTKENSGCAGWASQQLENVVGAHNSLPKSYLVHFLTRELTE
jgi:hypothetical protein